ncbi:MAG: transcription/translation regulatory transformer protein RfaH [Oceanospirillaceae bacterium]|nr:transcription/translation regulatory transformer protein RfaH [Oceanospirillaceae bacterium]
MSHYNWYLISAKPGQALKAQAELENQGFDTYLPQIEVEKPVRGKLTTKLEPLFPGYLFIYLSEVESNWRPIRSTRGVAKIVSFGNSPAVVPADAVAAIRAQLRGKVAESEFKADTPVTITEGPFKGLSAIFSAYDGEQRAFLLLELLGKWQRISLDLKDITSRD